jgi:acetoin utilization protein AcuC
MVTGPFLIGSDIYRTSSYGRNHPLAIPRVSTLIDLVRALGWLDPASYIESPIATPDELARFHAPDYVAALQRAEADQHIPAETARRFNIGCNGNPLFREIFSRPATACGGSLAAAEMMLAARTPVTIYSPAGGTHHGRPGRASGFCYLNDPVLAMLRLLDGGVRRVWYVDLDAHHGDGVQDAFAEDGRVVMLSVHEEKRWPYTGAAHEEGCGNVFNLPVPAGFGDDELAFLLDAVILPLGEATAPEMIVVQCGADALAEDPLSKLALSNHALWRAVAAISDLARRHRASLLVLGGGGYNPWSVARCWTGVWAVLNDIPIPARLPEAGEAVLRRLSWSRSAGRNPPEHWFTTLADQPSRASNAGVIRDPIRALAQVLAPRLQVPETLLAEAV